MLRQGLVLRRGFPATTCILQQRLVTGILNRSFHASHELLSEINPLYPDDSYLVKVRRPGQAISQPIDPKLRLGQSPMYTSPLGHQVAFTKRWSVGIMLVGGYIGHLVFNTAGWSTLASTLGLLPLIVPVPIIQYLTAPYVTRIFRVYNREEPQTLENLTRNETLALERIGLFGRRTYYTLVEVDKLRIVKKRWGWVNWQYKDEKGVTTNFYVADNVGGLKMDRIWGILEKNSGIDNGREFLNKLEEDDDVTHKE